MKDEFADFEVVSPAPDEFADFEPVAGDEGSATRAYTPAELKERLRLQRQQKADLAASDAADERLADAESTAEIARPFLRGAVDLADGVLGLPRLIASAPVAAYNVLTGSNAQLPISQSVGDINPRILADAIAGQKPARNVLAARDDTEQLESTLTRGLGGVLGGVGAGTVLSGLGNAGNTVANIGRTLAANPALQTAGAVTGGAASEIAREAGGGALAQLGAGIAGGLAPSAALTGASALTRAALRGGEAGRQQVERNLDTFVRAGTTPSVGQATEGRTGRAIESLLSRLPGGAGRIGQKAETQAAEIGAGIEKTATRLSPRLSAEQAGRRIDEGISGAGGFRDRTKIVQQALYDTLDQHLAPDTSTSIANTQAALKKLTAVDPGAPRTTGSLVNSRIKQIAADLEADAGTSGAVPYSAIKALRTKVGELLDEGGLVSDVPQKQLRRVYGALTEDLEEAATKAGPDAKQAWSRANTYTRVLNKRLEALDQIIDKQGGPEAVFNAATSGTKDGATKLRRVMQSLDDDGQRAVSATILRRLGRANNSQQDNQGQRFSTETFLSNWGKLSDEAKTALFDRFGTQYRRDIDAISRVTSNLREGSKVFKNPSGTGQANAQVGAASAGGAALASLIAGHPGPAVALGAALGGTYFSARLMTNPDFVRWLAVSTRLPASMYTSQLNQLAQIGQRKGDQDLIDAAQSLKEKGREKQDDAADQDNEQQRQQ